MSLFFEHNIMHLKLVVLFFFVLFFGSAKSQLVSQFNPLPFEIEQNNKKITIIRKGDYGNHWLESMDGYRIFYNQGNFEYAIKKDIDWKSSGILVSENLVENVSLKRELEKFSRYDGNIKQQSLQLKSGDGVGGVPNSGEVKLPVICVEYSDLKHTRTKDDIQRMFNQEGYKGNLSLAEYFKNSSHGKLNFSFDVVGWVSTTDSYTNYSESKGMYNAGKAVKKAILAANTEGIDFSNYDNDNEGM